MIKYIKGDATSPQAAGPKLIIHIVNTLGAWGRGFVMSLSKRWPEPEQYYRRWHHDRRAALLPKRLDGRLEVTGDFALGESQLVQVKPDTFVLNMVAQEGLRGGSKGPPIRYPALAMCLRHANRYANDLGATVHGPRFGSGLAGGDWEKVAALVERLVTRPTTIYDFD